MRKDRFYLQDIRNPLFTDAFIIHKLKDVLRKKTGDTIYVFDGKGTEFEAQVEKIKPRIIELSILRIVRHAGESALKMSLGFSLLKSPKVDFVIQKATELGVDEFSPFISKNTIVKKPGASKISHWRKIILESTAQSKRLFVPKLNEILSIEGFIEKISYFDLILVADPHSLQAKDVLGKINKEAVKSIFLLVGPEGGLTESEIEKFKDNEKLHLVRISNFILRAETACIILAGIAAHFFNKDEV